MFGSGYRFFVICFLGCLPFILNAEFNDLPFSVQYQEVKARLEAENYGDALGLWRGMPPHTEQTARIRVLILKHLQSFPVEDDTPELVQMRMELMVRNPVPRNFGFHKREIERGGAKALHAYTRAGDRPADWSRTAELSITMGSLVHEGKWPEVLGYEKEALARPPLSESFSELPPLQTLLAAAKAANGKQEEALDLYFAAWNLHRTDADRMVLKQVAVLEGFIERFNELREQNLKGVAPVPAGVVLLPSTRDATPAQRSLRHIQNGLRYSEDPVLLEVMDRMQMARMTSTKEWSFWLNSQFSFHNAKRQSPNRLLPVLTRLMTDYPDGASNWMNLRGKILFEGKAYNQEAYEKEFAFALEHPRAITPQYVKMARAQTRGKPRVIPVGGICEAVLRLEDLESATQAGMWKEYLGWLNSTKDRELQAAKITEFLIPAFLENRVPAESVPRLVKFMRQRKQLNPFFTAYLESDADPRIAYEAGQALLKRDKRSVDLMKMAHAKDPSDPVIRGGLVSAYRKWGLEAEAEALEASPLPKEKPVVPEVAVNTSDDWWALWSPDNLALATGAYLQLPMEEQMFVLVQIEERLRPTSGWMSKAGPEEIALGNWMRTLPDLSLNEWILAMKLAHKDKSIRAQLNREAKFWKQPVQKHVLFVLNSHPASVKEDHFQAWADTRPPVEELKAVADLIEYKHWGDRYTVPLQEAMALQGSIGGQDAAKAVEELIKKAEYLRATEVLLQSRSSNEELRESHGELIIKWIARGRGMFDESDFWSSLEKIVETGDSASAEFPYRGRALWYPQQVGSIYLALHHHGNEKLEAAMEPTVQRMRVTTPDRYGSYSFMLDLLYHQLTSFPDAKEKVEVLKQMLSPLVKQNPAQSLPLDKVWMITVASQGEPDVWLPLMMTWLEKTELHPKVRWELALWTGKWAKDFGIEKQLLPYLGKASWPNDYEKQALQPAWLYGIAGDMKVVTDYVGTPEKPADGWLPYEVTEFWIRLHHHRGEYQQSVDLFQRFPEGPDEEGNEKKAWLQAYHNAGFFAGASMSHLGKRSEGYAMVMDHVSSVLKRPWPHHLRLTTLQKTPGFLQQLTVRPETHKVLESRSGYLPRSNQVIELALMLAFLHPHREESLRKDAIQNISQLEDVATAIRWGTSPRKFGPMIGSFSGWMSVMEALSLTHPDQAEPLHLLRLEWCKEYRGTPARLLERETAYRQKFPNGLPAEYLEFLQTLEATVRTAE